MTQLSNFARKNWKGLVLVVVVLLIAIMFTVIFDVFSRIEINSASALEFFSVSAQISGTIFSIFTGFVLLIIEKEAKEDIKKELPKWFFIFIVIFFSLGIIGGLCGVFMIDQNTTKTINGKLIITELAMVGMGIFVIFGFLWDYYDRKSRDSRRA